MFSRLLAGLLLSLGAAAAGAASEPKPDAVVAADGSGQYKTINEAVEAAPRSVQDLHQPWTILVKPGLYKELLSFERERAGVRLVGEDAEKTIVSFNWSERSPGPDGAHMSYYRACTVIVDADDFVAENITIENTAGPKMGNAGALEIEGDRCVFRHCRILGSGDTLLLVRNRQYFEDCTITGNGDFIFGGGTAFFERCHIQSLGQRNASITAPSTPKEVPYGLVFSHCTVTGARPQNRSYLGRPWRRYGASAFLHCDLSEVILPAGWNDWKNTYAQSTARFAECDNKGPGAGKPGDRPSWIKQLSPREAEAYAVDQVLAGADGWNPVAKAR